MALEVKIVMKTPSGLVPVPRAENYHLGGFLVTLDYLDKKEPILSEAIITNLPQGYPMLLEELNLQPPTLGFWRKDTVSGAREIRRMPDYSVLHYNPVTKSKWQDTPYVYIIVVSGKGWEVWEVPRRTYEEQDIYVVTADFSDFRAFSSFDDFFLQKSGHATLTILYKKIQYAGAHDWLVQGVYSFTMGEYAFDVFRPWGYYLPVADYDETGNAYYPLYGWGTYLMTETGWAHDRYIFAPYGTTVPAARGAGYQAVQVFDGDITFYFPFALSNHIGVRDAVFNGKIFAPFLPASLVGLSGEVVFPFKRRFVIVDAEYNSPTVSWNFEDKDLPLTPDHPFVYGKWVLPSDIDTSEVIDNAVPITQVGRLVERVVFPEFQNEISLQKPANFLFQRIHCPLTATFVGTTPSMVYHPVGWGRPPRAIARNACVFHVGDYILGPSEAHLFWTLSPSNGVSLPELLMPPSYPAVGFIVKVKDAEPLYYTRTITYEWGPVRLATFNKKGGGTLPILPASAEIAAPTYNPNNPWMREVFPFSVVALKTTNIRELLHPYLEALYPISLTMSATLSQEYAPTLSVPILPWSPLFPSLSLFAAGQAYGSFVHPDSLYACYLCSIRPQYEAVEMEIDTWTVIAENLFSQDGPTFRMLRQTFTVPVWLPHPQGVFYYKGHQLLIEVPITIRCDAPLFVFLSIGREVVERPPRPPEYAVTDQGRGKDFLPAWLFGYSWWYWGHGDFNLNVSAFLLPLNNDALTVEWQSGQRQRFWTNFVIGSMWHPQAARRGQVALDDFQARLRNVQLGPTVPIAGLELDAARCLVLFDNGSLWEFRCGRLYRFVGQVPIGRFLSAGLPSLSLSAHPYEVLVFVPQAQGEALVYVVNLRNGQVRNLPLDKAVAVAPQMPIRQVSPLWTPGQNIAALRLLRGEVADWKGHTVELDESNVPVPNPKTQPTMHLLEVNRAAYAGLTVIPFTDPVEKKLSVACLWWDTLGSPTGNAKPISLVSQQKKLLNP